MLRYRGGFGEVSELTALGGTVQGDAVAGGSVETAWLQAGWRLEVLGFERTAEPLVVSDAGTLSDGPEGGAARGSSGIAGASGAGVDADTPERAVFAVAGVDRRFEGGWTVLAEWYHHSLGAYEEAELNATAALPEAASGDMPQLAANVLALGVDRELGGLWSAGYTAFGSALTDAADEQRWSVLHQLTAGYSIADNAEATFSFLTATGRGLDGTTGALRSEFGHVPDTLYVKLSFVL